MTVRIVFLFSLLVVLPSCSSGVEQTNTDRTNVAPSNQIQSNATNSFDTPVEPPPVSDEELKKLNEVTDRFRVVPPEFKGVDFKNGTYSYKLSRSKKSFRLKDGSYKYDLSIYNRGWLDLSDVLFVDVTGDSKKEAIVILHDISCGGSCDGGSAVIYIFSPKDLRSFPVFETGSIKYGCGLKSIQIKNRQFLIDVFGDCKNGSVLDHKSDGTGAFRFKDTTHFIYAYKNRFVLKERIVTGVPERSVKGYTTLVSVQE